jgi:hypothetical protein
MDEKKTEALNTNQFYEINKNPTIQMLTNQLAQRMSMINSARTALWSSLLTSNSIFFAFFYFVTNRHYFPGYITIPLVIILLIPMIISLCLFLFNKHSNEECHKLELLTYDRIFDYVKTQKEQEKNNECTIQENRCKQVERNTKFIIKYFEPIAVYVTMFSLVAIVVLFIISCDC